MNLDAITKEEVALFKEGDPISHWGYEFKPRTQQIDAITEIIEAFKDYDVVGLDAATGIGKSAIAVTLSEASNAGAILLTHTLALERQYVEESPRHMAVLHGASNYSCNTAIALTKGQNKNCKDGSKVCNKEHGENQNSICPYKIAKFDFLKSNASITNYAYFTRVIQTDIVFRHKILVCDEAHNLSSALIDAYSLTFNKQFFEEGLNVDFDRASRPCNTAAEIKSMINHYLPDIKKMYIKLDAMVEDDVILSNKDARMYDQLEGMLINIDHLMGDIGENEYVQSVEDVWSKSGITDRNVTIKPLYSLQFFKHLLDLDMKILLMSATLPPDEVLEGDLGIVPYRISKPSPFEIQNKPIVVNPIASPSYNDFNTAMPKIAKGIADIAALHEDDRGIVHCQSFKAGKAIEDAIGDLGGRMLYHRKGEDKKQLLNQHRLRKNSVLVSPSMHEGMDFKGDLARFCIIPKLPYPNFGDKWTKKRCEDDPTYFGWNTTLTIIQSVGRVVRNEEDWGISYIIDARFMNFFRTNAKLFPSDFIEALEEVE